MRFSLKLAASFGVMSALVGAVAYFSSGAQRELQRDLEFLSRQAIVDLAGATTMNDAVNGAHLAAHELLREGCREQPTTVADESAERLKRRGGDTIETHLDRFERSLERSLSTHDSFSREAGKHTAAGETTQNSREMLGRLEESFEEYRDSMDHFLRAIAADPAEAERVFDMRVTPLVRSGLLPQIEAFQEGTELAVTRGLRNAERTMARARNRRNYITLSSLGVALLLGALISLSIGRPLAVLTKATGKVAQGRLDTRVAIHSRDEIGKLGEAFNRMTAGLQTTTVARDYVDNIIHSMHEILIVTDPQLNIRRVNRAAVRRLGFAEDALVGRPLAEILGEPVDWADDLAAPGAQMLEARERLLPTGSRQPLPVWFTASALRQADGELQGLVCVATDISERKAAEQQLRNSLHEKEVLLKEVHHRVKNNLQVISSLLNLQTRQTEHSEAVRALRDSQSRIHSMALIHEQLYRSDNLANIDFAEYVRQLTAQVCRSLGAAARNVSVRVEVDPTPLSLDQAVPCGMIINELFTNAMEHAFPQGGGGEIAVSFRDRNGRRELTVSDNGVGLNTTNDNESSESLGLKVVQALCVQLGGELRLEHDHGTQCTILF
jgi:PAS domain S-box-containing protein